MKNDHISGEIEKNFDPGRKVGDGIVGKVGKYSFGDDFESHQESSW